MLGRNHDDEQIVGCLICDRATRNGKDLHKNGYNF